MYSVFNRIDSLIEKIKARHAAENDVITGAPKINATDIELVSAVELLTKLVEKMFTNRIGIIPDLRDDTSLYQFLGEYEEQLEDGMEVCRPLHLTNDNQTLYYYKFGGQVLSGVYSSSQEFKDAKIEWLKNVSGNSPQ